MTLLKVFCSDSIDFITVTVEQSILKRRGWGTVGGGVAAKKESIEEFCTVMKLSLRIAECFPIDAKLGHHDKKDTCSRNT